MSAYMEVVEPPLDTTLYRYGLGMLPAAYFLFMDFLAFTSYLLNKPGVLSVQTQSNSDSILSELLSWTPEKDEMTKNFEREFFGQALNAKGNHKVSAGFGSFVPPTDFMYNKVTATSSTGTIAVIFLTLAYYGAYFGYSIAS
jgi:hypothetical protein